ncbi:MAG TPA: TIGR03086 family metal-binding protein [Candidatus Methylomirabilis sp.]|nr:TIGR03086 family metal-binding protein [Candidatus Methylomirabilis sp.]
MKGDLVEVHGRCGGHFAQLVAGVDNEQWHTKTPCTEWDVRALVHHLLYEQRWVAPLLEGLTVTEVGDRFEGDLLGDDATMWADVFASSLSEAQAAIAQPGALKRTVHLSFGDTPGEEYVMQLTGDLAIHAWDLARATGQDDAIDAGAIALLLPWAEANADLLAGSGMFGSPVDLGSDVSDQDRLLGLVGRHA